MINIVRLSYQILTGYYDFRKDKKDPRVVRLRILHTFCLEWIGWNRITFVTKAPFSLMPEVQSYFTSAIHRQSNHLC